MSAPLLVLGLGNVLCADDGAGVEAVGRLEREFVVDPAVRVLDGGTLGLALLPYLENAERALLVDAVVSSEPPGTILRAQGDEVPVVAQQKLSCHQIGVAELLECARLIGATPEITLIGIVAASVESLGAPSIEVTSRIDQLVDCVVEEIRRCGFAVQPRHEMPRPDTRNATGDRIANDETRDRNDAGHAGTIDRHRWM